MSASIQRPVSSVEVNVADRLTTVAQRMPDAIAVACPGRGDVAGRNQYAICTFGALDADANAIARGLIEAGVEPGDRMALLVRPGIEFVKLVFGLLRSGATTVLVDPGMGIHQVIGCLASMALDGFAGIGRAHMLRVLCRRAFPNARYNITVGRRWFWGGATYRQLLARGQRSSVELPSTKSRDAAAVIFTSGSTGPAKGVLYTHEMFDAQAHDIQRKYDIQPGGADLSCFPLFGLFNSAMGITTVFPDMDFSRPATCDPEKLLAAADDWQVTQAFASPAVWDKLSQHCQRTGEILPTLRKVFSCGAPVPAAVLRRTLQSVAPNSEMHTPYGATEALPVATIAADEVLAETADATDQGAGVCVGRKFDSINWRVIRITDDPIATIDDAEELPNGEIGELIVRGPQVSPAYVQTIAAVRVSADGHDGPSPTDDDPNSTAKIHDGDKIWHRMGDVGYLDDQRRFLYCGRKNHRVETAGGTLYTIPIEAIFNAHANVARTALVGVGRAGEKTPVLIVEPRGEVNHEQLIDQLSDLAAQNSRTAQVRKFLIHESLPVDIRHNSKIRREELAAWSTRELGGG